MWGLISGDTLVVLAVQQPPPLCDSCVGPFLMGVFVGAAVLIITLILLETWGRDR